MIDCATKHRAAFVCLVKDIECFEFEDIKSTQQIVFELLQADNNKIESILKQFGNDIISRLLHSFSKRDIANFVGLYLRLFTHSTVSSIPPLLF